MHAGSLLTPACTASPSLVLHLGEDLEQLGLGHIAVQVTHVQARVVGGRRRGARGGACSMAGSSTWHSQQAGGQAKQEAKEDGRRRWVSAMALAMASSTAVARGG